MPRPLALVALLLSISPCIANADVIRVPAEKPTIQAAIHAATTGDTVEVAPGTYFEQIDFVGKAITVRSSGGPTVTTIDSAGMRSWGDQPFSAIVRFVNAEGAASVLEGFTLTGYSDFANYNSAPVRAVAPAAPTLIDCHIRDNYGGEGAYSGAGTLLRCSVLNNTGNLGAPGAGVSGPTQLYDCLIQGNEAVEANGGGIATTGGMLAVRCTIIDNDAGGDGRSGGGVFGPAVLIDCLIARNTGTYYGGQCTDCAGAVDGAVLLDGCTVVGNDFGASVGYTLLDVGRVVDSIVWGNIAGSDLDPGTASATSYSCIEDGIVGTGNLATDPLFRDAVNGDYTLDFGSPCKDAGDPTSRLDLDGTRADIGAYFVPQYSASWALRYGTSSATDYVPGQNPVIGEVFDPSVLGDPTTTLTAVVVYTGGTSPIPTQYGELLVDLTSTFVLSDFVPAVNGRGDHVIAIPSDTDLIGTRLATQGVRFGGGAELLNAIDLVLGL